jgi:hypothetical protein
MTTPELSDAAKTACETAANNIRDIEYLQDQPEFKRFMDGFRRRADQMADEVLHNDAMTAGEREATRQKRLGVLEILQAPSLIIQGSGNVLKSHGMNR